MATWFANLTSSNPFSNIGLFSIGNQPNKVLEVKSDKYSSCNVIKREESIVLYGPIPKENKFEIVIHQANCDQCYSVFRTQDQAEAEARFEGLKDKLPSLIIISPVVNTVSGVQKVCDTLQEHPSWNIAHIAVFHNLIDCLNSDHARRYFDTPDSFSGESPLQLAIKKQNLVVVRILLAANVSLEHLDHEGNSVFHYAASTNKDIIMTLLHNGQPKCLNYRNVTGYTPLHIACLVNKTDCVQTLLSMGADVNVSATAGQPSGSALPAYVGDFMQENAKKLYVQDMKFGGTPLHWSCSREVIEQLVDRNCDINVLNFDKRTALHVMVLRNRLECVVALLSRYADPDMPDVDGNTALHLAVKNKNIPIIQALIVFDADFKYMNNKGQTVRHMASEESDEASSRVLYLLHAVGATRCPPDTHGCTDGCLAGGDWNGIPPPTPPSAPVRAITRLMEAMANRTAGRKGCRVLCLDGGGIRGLILVSVLLHIEALVNQPIIHCFDWVAGTSTGAILALALAAGKSLKDCRCLYFRMKEHAFCGMKPYSSEPLETMLQETLGTDTVMSDISHPKLIITGVLADRKPVDLHLFRNYPSPSELISPDSTASGGAFAAPPAMQDQLLWKAARASGAAPSFFRAFGRFIDGGLIANNPTMDALTEIHEYNTAMKVIGRGDEVSEPSVVVSIGTGCVPVKQLAQVDVFRPESLFDTARLAFGLSALASLLVDQATQADGRVIERCSAWCSMINVPFYRFSPQLSEDIAMDAKSDEILVNMLWETKSYIFSNDSTVKELAPLLNEQLSRL